MKEPQLQSASSGSASEAAPGSDVKVAAYRVPQKDLQMKIYMKIVAPRLYSAPLSQHLVESIFTAYRISSLLGNALNSF